VKTESKKISANRNKRGRSKNKPKKGTNVTRKIEGKKLRAMRKKGAEKDEREKKERDIRTFLFPSKSCYILLIQVRERGRDNRETL
jgi:hypothetical protein